MRERSQVYPRPRGDVTIVLHDTGQRIEMQNVIFAGLRRGPGILTSEWTVSVYKDPASTITTHRGEVDQ